MFPIYTTFGSSNGIELITSTATNQTVVTGTTSNTITYSFLIPANTFQTGDIFMFDFRNVFTGTANNKTTRVYINNTNDLATPDQIANKLSGSTVLSLDLARRVSIKSTTVTQVYAITNSNAGADFESTIAVTEINIDWTANQYFIVAIQLGNAADSGVLSHFRLLR